MIRYFSSSVVRLFSSIVLLLVTLGLIGFGTLIGYYNFDQTIKDLNSKSQNTVELAAISLQLPISNVDAEAWDLIVEAIFLDSDIEAVQILDADGGMMVEEKLGIASDLSFEEMGSHRGLILNKGLVKREGESIGEVTVVSSTLKVEQTIRQTSILIVIFSASLLTAMILAIRITGRRLLSKPIGALVASANELARGNLETAIDTERHDELGRLAKSFDWMRCSIGKKISDLNVLNQIGEILAETRDQTEAMKTSLRIMHDHAGVDRSSIYLLEDGHLQLYACYPEIHNAGVARHFDLGEGIAGRCAEEKVTKFVANTKSSEHFVPANNKGGSFALLCVPMMDNHKVFGVMNFLGEVNSVTFESGDEDFALTIARMVVHTIKNIQMLEIIKEQNRTLEHNVQERTAELGQKSSDINNMLQNMQQGIFTITREHVVHNEYSAFLEEIFARKDIAATDAVHLLFDNSDLGADRVDQIRVALDAIIGEDLMMFEINGHILARDYSMSLENGGQKILELDWIPIPSDDDIVDKLMVTVRDVTELRGLQIEAESRKSELNTIGQILAISQSKFQSFIGSTNDFILENRSLIESTDEKDMDVIAILFRNMHTIKGNARIYGLSYATDTVHDAETSYDVLRKDQNAVWERQKLLEELDQVEQKINYYENIFEDKLAGFSGSRGGRFIEKSLLEEIDCVVHDADSLLQQNNPDELAKVEGIVVQMRNVLGAIFMESLKNILEPVSDSLPSMAYDLGKLEPAVVLIDNGIRFSEDIVPLLKNVFMHIFRNSIDHGLEPVAERVAAGKPKRGTIELEVRHERGKLVFCVSDDGRGLNLWAIKQKAIANGMVAELDELSDENLAQLIFHSGLSTADSITIVSGRGVGMHAVRQFLESKGGAIEIRFTGERNDVGYRPIELIVTLPGSESVQLKKAA